MAINFWVKPINVTASRKRTSEVVTGDVYGETMGERGKTEVDVCGATTGGSPFNNVMSQRTRLGAALESPADCVAFAKDETTTLFQPEFWDSRFANSGGRSSIRKHAASVWVVFWPDEPVSLHVLKHARPRATRETSV